jgi:hypothetical protein
MKSCNYAYMPHTSSFFFLLKNFPSPKIRHIANNRVLPRSLLVMFSPRANNGIARILPEQSRLGSHYLLLVPKSLRGTWRSARIALTL